MNFKNFRFFSNLLKNPLFSCYSHAFLCSSHQKFCSLGYPRVPRQSPSFSAASGLRPAAGRPRFASDANSRWELLKIRFFFQKKIEKRLKMAFLLEFFIENLVFLRFFSVFSTFSKFSMSTCLISPRWLFLLLSASLQLTYSLAAKLKTKWDFALKRSKTTAVFECLSLFFLIFCDKTSEKIGNEKCRMIWCIVCNHCNCGLCIVLYDVFFKNCTFWSFQLVFWGFPLSPVNSPFPDTCMKRFRWVLRLYLIITDSVRVTVQMPRRRRFWTIMTMFPASFWWRSIEKWVFRKFWVEMSGFERFQLNFSENRWFRMIFLWKIACFELSLLVFELIDLILVPVFSSWFSTIFVPGTRRNIELGRRVGYLSAGTISAMLVYFLFLFFVKKTLRECFWDFQIFLRGFSTNFSAKIWGNLFEFVNSNFFFIFLDSLFHFFQKISVFQNLWNFFSKIFGFPRFST